MFKPSQLIIIGSQGFIGHHFCRAFPEALAIDRQQLDLASPCVRFPKEGYRFALIAAGIGNPRKCEEDPLLTRKCNVDGTLKLGKELLKTGIVPIFFSSDYVFDDRLQIAPLNVYGRQKRDLEEEALRLDALVVRLSKVYGVDKGDGTLFDEMAQQLVEGREIKAAYDQIFAPVFIGDVIRQIVNWLNLGVRGVVDLVGPHYASRLEMAHELVDQLGKERTLVKQISLDELNDGVKRHHVANIVSFTIDQSRELSRQPKSNSSLSWKEGIKKVVQNYATQ